ncbi:CoA transferase [Bordetella petrii]|nr:CoA transferase [Bordetella petrii]
MTSSQDCRPLAGVRVVEFGQFIAGPGATQILADLGADVVKIESPHGDNGRRFGVGAATGGRGGLFMAYNRGKRSVVLDMRQPAGLLAARRLALAADVVVQNLRAGTAQALGLDADALRREKPSLIHVTISGFGTRGPSHKRPGLDIAAQAESGMMSITGELEGPPLKVGFPIADVSTATAAANAILAALFRGARTGNGETIETSLLAVGISLQAQIWAEYQCTGKLPPRSGNAQPLVAPAADLIPVADGHIVVSAYLDDHWRRLCAAIGQPELTSDPRFIDNTARVKNRPALVEILCQALGSLSGEAARTRLERHQVVVGMVRNYAQVLASPDVEAMGIFQPVRDEKGGELMLPGLPFTFSSCPDRGRAPAVPALGQHTSEVLREAGFARDEICALLPAEAAHA